MELRISFAAKLGTMTDQPLSRTVTPPDVSEERAALSMALYDTSAETLGFMKKRRQDWFNENNAAIVRIVAEKNQAHNNYLSRPSQSNELKWKELQTKVRDITREMKNTW